MDNCFQLVLAWWWCSTKFWVCVVLFFGCRTI